MNAVEEHVRRPFLIRARSPRARAGHRAELLVFQKLLNARSKPQRRTRKARHVLLLRQIVNHNRVRQRTGHRLVDEKRLARFEHRNGIFQVRAAIDALQQNHIHFFEQLRNRIDNLNSHPAQLLCEFPDAIRAVG